MFALDNPAGSRAFFYPLADLPLGARRKESIMEKQSPEWKWYVYKFYSGETCVYVGKGCGSRFSCQSKRFKDFNGHIVACFKNESDALSYEKGQILELAPQLNKAHMPEIPKPWTVRLLPEDRDFYSWCSSIGTRAVAARICLKYWWMIPSSNLDQIRRVAYG